MSRKDRCPTWEEMCQVKDLFWDDEDVVMQFHVPSKDHVNNHPYCLHLWRPVYNSEPPLWFLEAKTCCGRIASWSDSNKYLTGTSKYLLKSTANLERRKA